MQFGLWIEPEMVNPDSDLYREHPDWILSAGDRTPLLHRNQLVLDLSRAEVREHVFGQISEVLSAYPIDAVKWDHNRDLLEAGSGRWAARRPCTGRRPASTRCSTTCVRRTRRSTGSRARRVAAGSTSACSSGCSGSGPPT